MNDPEPLYFGDKRLDALYEALENEIYARCGGQDICTVSVVGVLEKLKLDLINKEFYK